MRRVGARAVVQEKSILALCNSEAVEQRHTRIRANVYSSRRNSICQRGCVVLFHEPDSVSMYARRGKTQTTRHPPRHARPIIKLASAHLRFFPFLFLSQLSAPFFPVASFFSRTTARARARALVALRISPSKSNEYSMTILPCVVAARLLLRVGRYPCRKRRSRTS